MKDADLKDSNEQAARHLKLNRIAISIRVQTANTIFAGSILSLGNTAVLNTILWSFNYGTAKVANNSRQKAAIESRAAC